MLAAHFPTCSHETYEQQQSPPEHTAIYKYIYKYIWCVCVSAHCAEMEPCALTAARSREVLGVGWQQTAPKPVQLPRAGEGGKQTERLTCFNSQMLQEAWHQIAAPNSTGLSRVSGAGSGELLFSAADPKWAKSTC